ncbi:MAG: shikimate dehydrogenase [Clostridia bacterium]|jgi:shikimate dehydrogenase|nr:shikimate dehydrogenase [Clostridia bacterium]
MLNIDSKTRLIGLLGHPLTHSYSPLLQNAAFTQLNLNTLYIPIEVTEQNLGDVIRGMVKMNFDGFNVTIPHKINILNYLDAVDEPAAAIGAVNCVTIKEGCLKGYNTDGSGFLRSFEQGTGETVQGKNILLLGSGGAARAIAMTLALRGAQRINIFNRTVEKAEALAREINSKIKSGASTAVEERALQDVLADTDSIINTTSVGMYPQVEETPLDKSLLRPELIVCDIVYNPEKTRLLRDAEEIGCRTLPGLPMLIYQGAESFSLWTGLEAPVETMFSALKNKSAGM